MTSDSNFNKIPKLAYDFPNTFSPPQPSFKNFFKIFYYFFSEDFFWVVASEC